MSPQDSSISSTYFLIMKNAVPLASSSPNPDVVAIRTIVTVPTPAGTSSVNITEIHDRNYSTCTCISEKVLATMLL